MGSDHHVDPSAGQTLQGLPLHRFAGKPAEQTDVHRKTLHPAHQIFEMLLSQNSGRSQHCSLPTIHYALKHSTKSHFGFAEPDISAQKTIHDLFRFHIALDFPDTAQLILGFFKRKVFFKFLLPDGILAEGMAFNGRALGIKTD